VITLIPRCPRLARMFCVIVSLNLILRGFGCVAEGVFGAEAHQPFANLKADVDLDIEDGEFEIMINFTLAAGSNGIDPSAETVTLQVSGGKASFSVTIPPNSFKKQRNGEFAFQGTINRVRLQASIRPKRDSAFELEIEGDRVNLKGVANPVSVSLTIGDDGGSGVGKAKIE
jgi:hypothetical protein